MQEASFTPGPELESPLRGRRELVHQEAGQHTHSRLPLAPCSLLCLMKGNTTDGRFLLRSTGQVLPAGRGRARWTILAILLCLPDRVVDIRQGSTQEDQGAFLRKFVTELYQKGNQLCLSMCMNQSTLAGFCHGRCICICRCLHLQRCLHL
jgi:hypothetical protein